MRLTPYGVCGLKLKEDRMREEKRYLVKEAKTGTDTGGMACGPVSRNRPLAVVKVYDGKDAKYITAEELEGDVLFYVSDSEKLFNGLAGGPVDDEVYKELVEDGLEENAVSISYAWDHNIEEIDGIPLPRSFDDILAEIRSAKPASAAFVVLILLALIRISDEEAAVIIKAVTGHYAGEIDIDKSLFA